MPPFPFFSFPFQNPTNNSSSNKQNPSLVPPNPLQLHLSSFLSGLQSSAHGFLSNFCPAGSIPTRPLFARVSASSASAQRIRKFSKPQLEERLEGIPVYALSTEDDQFVLVSGSRTEKSLGLFCFRKEDAESILQEVKRSYNTEQELGKVVPVALNKVFQLKIDGIAFRFVPDSSQVKKAITEMENIGESTGGKFPGVPVFQSKSLFVRSGNERYRPVFFRKEDLDDSLAKASLNERKSNPALKKGDIQVGVLEEMIKGMTDESSNQWDDVVFIPPGFQMSIGQTESNN